MVVLLDQLASYSYSGYLDGTFAVTPTLFVTAGVRYNYDHKAYNSFIGGNINVPAFGLNIPYGPGVVPVQNASLHNTTPRANIRYQLSENTNVYATFSQGFKAGTFNSINAVRMWLSSRHPLSRNWLPITKSATRCAAAFTPSPRPLITRRFSRSAGRNRL